MKLVRFEGGAGPRIGAIQGDEVVDLTAVREAMSLNEDLVPPPTRSLLKAWHFPSSMRAFLAAGEPAMEAARQALGFAERYEGDARLGAPLKWGLSQVTLLPPVGDPQKIVCIGQNYRDHCEEQHQPLPDTAIIFAKFPTALIGPGASIKLPRISEKVDYEAELAFVIGKGGRSIPEDRAAAHVAGYMCLNDVSARDIQFADKQWVRGKTFDTFAPIGPALVTADEIPDPHALGIRLTLNGQVMQRSNTSNLIFGVFFLVSFLSEVMTLEPGDIVTTGTPGGVGVFRDPPVFLKPGDTVSVTIDGIGTLTNPVEAA